MKYKLLKELPLAEIGEELEITDFNWLESMLTIKNAKWKWIADIQPMDVDEWLEPIVEKKSVHDLEEWDRAFWIWYNWLIKEYEFNGTEVMSETFLTREEAEDEHKRREWAVRKDKFIPDENSSFYFPNTNWYILCSEREDNYEIIFINLWLAFRTREECQDAIDNHDIIRLFYQIR